MKQPIKNNISCLNLPINTRSYYRIYFRNMFNVPNRILHTNVFIIMFIVGVGTISETIN